MCFLRVVTGKKVRAPDPHLHLVLADGTWRTLSEIKVSECSLRYPGMNCAIEWMLLSLQCRDKKQIRINILGLYEECLLTTATVGWLSLLTLSSLFAKCGVQTQTATTTANSSMKSMEGDSLQINSESHWSHVQFVPQ